MKSAAVNIVIIQSDIFETPKAVIMFCSSSFEPSSGSGDGGFPRLMKRALICRSWRRISMSAQTVIIKTSERNSMVKF